jgi:hypothetical protein
MTRSSHFIRYTRTSAGRRIVAARRVKEIAAAEAMPEVAARCDIAIASSERELQTDQDYKTMDPSKARAEALELDTSSDTAIHIIQNVCQAHASASRRGFKTRHAQAAELVIKRLIPQGAQFITNSSYEEQLAKMRLLVKNAEDPEVVQALDTLALTEHLAIVRDNLDAYEVAIRRIARSLTYRDVLAIRQDGHDTYCELVAQILLSTSTPDKLELRAHLLSPISEQYNIQLAQIRSRRPKTDLDPKTGQEIVLDPSTDDPEEG